MKKSVILLSLLQVGCLSLDGIEIGGLERDQGVLTKFQCQNGYSGSIKVRDNGNTTFLFSDGKNIYAPNMSNIGTLDRPIYANEQRTLQWKNDNGRVQFTYPSVDYAQSRQLSYTLCNTY